ncbi:MipA/OmpV family protein [Sphingomonas sp. LB-2]|uniref:MipA/OmpV family protein n=1 Tax=Sphingomonas caeni TaxID=2984949 RepID=UPI002232552B|nr:MipA/OmpV family protein [Sphingomonas caeni]MCW3846551.1 MipA/OmpV family protein [Sphingomonas caeni]
MPRILFLLPLLIASPALAQEADAPAPAPQIDPARLDGDSLSIGAAIGFTPSYEGSDDRVLAIVPGVRGRLSRINFTLRGNRFWADIVPTKGGPGWDVQLGPVVSVNFNRSAAIVDAQVRALPHRRTAVEVGGFAGIGRQGVITSDYDKLSLSVAGTYDIAGSHKSYVITPSLDYGTPLSTKAYIGINVSGDYMGEGYAGTYFSIDTAGSTASGLPVFTAHRGWKDWTVSTVGVVSLTGDLTGGLALMSGVSYRRMLGDAADSPVTRIAGSPDQWTGLLGLAYTF